MSWLTRSAAWSEKWNSRVRLLMYYLLYALALWSLAWVVVDSPIPRPPLYDYVTTEPELATFIVAILIWVTSKDGIAYYKQQVFGGCDETADT